MRKLRLVAVTLLVLLLGGPAALSQSSSSVVGESFTVGQPPIHSIVGVALTNASFTAGASPGTTVGKGIATLFPALPAFGGTWSLTGTNAGSFSVDTAGNLTTVGTLCPSSPPCSYSINLVASLPGLTGSPFSAPFTITAIPPITPGTGDVDIVLAQPGLTVPAFWSVTKAGKSGYTGPAVSLRRDSDGTTQTFNILSSGTIDIAGINSFCGIDSAHPATPNGNGGTLGCRWASVINQRNNGTCDLVSGNAATGRPFSENPLQGGLSQYDTIRAPNNSLIWALAAHNCTIVNGTQAQAIVNEMFMPDGNTCCGQMGWEETTDFTTVQGSMLASFIPLTGQFGQNAPWFGLDLEGGSQSVCCSLFQPGLMQEVGTLDGSGNVGYYHNGVKVIDPHTAPPFAVNHQETMGWGRDGDAAFNGPLHARSTMVIAGLPSDSTIASLAANMKARAAQEATTPAIVQLSTANTITLVNQSGTPLAAWPFQFGRPFRPGDIPHAPQVLASNGAVPSQVDVKGRFPDGSVKFAILATRVSLPAGTPVTLTFQDNATLRAIAPMTASQMQAAASANMTFTPTPSQISGSSVALNTMLANGDFTYWTGGAGSLSLDGNPVATSIKAEDNSLARKYDLGFGDGFHPFRPAYYVTYYGVAPAPAHIRFVGEASNDQELEDINYTVGLVVNGTTVVTRAYNGTTTLLSGYPLRHFSGSVWTEEYWAGTAPSAAVDMDFNALGYLADTRAFPQFNPSINVDVAYTNTQSSYIRNPNLAPFYPQEAGGWWLGGSGAVGGRPDIGSFPGPFVLPLYLGKWQQWAYARALADQFSAFPMQIKETKAGIILNLGDSPSSNSGLGYPISRNGWPNLRGFPIPPVGTIGPNIWNGPDPAHQPDPYFPLLMTAFPDQFYLDEDQHLAAWSVRNVFPGGCVGGNLQNCAIWEGNARGHWLDRNVCEAAVFTPDADPWHISGQQWIFNDIAWQEGAFRAPGAHFPTTALYANGFSNGPVGYAASALHGPPAPLGNQDVFVPSDQTDPNVVNNATIAGDNSPWMEHYADYARARCNALGFPEDAVIGATGKFTVGMINSSNFPVLAGIYRLAVAVKDSGGNPIWPTSWAQLLTGLNPAYLTGVGYPVGSNPSVGPLPYYFGTYGLDADQGYPVSAQLGGSGLAEIGIAGSSAMWNWMNANIANARAEANAGGSSDPRYDTIPYQGSVVLPRLTGNPP